MILMILVNISSRIKICPRKEKELGTAGQQANLRKPCTNYGEKHFHHGGGRS